MLTSITLFEHIGVNADPETAKKVKTNHESGTL
ncbi:MAG: hypothetical protein QG652_116 [Pseudomonadota bacterium]|nr:hypothetical protein [Pseudomonadota bacterium]